MADRVIIQTGTPADPEQLDFLLLYTKEEGKRLGFEDSDDIIWTPGPSGYGGVWSTTDQETAFSWARMNGQVAIHDNIKYEIIFEMVWRRKGDS